MILEIEPSHSNTLGPLAYNELKAHTQKEADAPDLATTSEKEEDIKTKGYEVATRNVPEGATLESEFARLKSLALSKRARKAITQESFHMSVNPSSADRKLSDEEAADFIDEVMKRLGYGDSPYRIYRHQDIAREHFHVVSTRIGQDGKKINNSFERYILHTVLKELSEKYGFSVEETRQDRVDNAIKTKKDIKAKEKKGGKTKPAREKGEYIPPFKRTSKEPVMEQISNAHEDAMQWHFSTFDQYRMLMRNRYSVDVEYLDENPDYPTGTLIYSGLENGVMRVTPALSENDLGIDGAAVAAKCGDERMSEKKAQKKRLEKAMRESMDSATSYVDLHAKMRERGIAMCVSWTKDGEPFGVTYFDYATKCIWKGSETATDFQWLKNSCETKGWEIIQGKREKPVLMKKDPRRGKQAPQPVVSGPTTSNTQRTASAAEKGKAPHIQRPANAGSGHLGVHDETDKKSEDEVMEEIRLGLR